MKRSKSSRWLGLIFLPLFAMLFVISACTNDEDVLQSIDSSSEQNISDSQTRTIEEAIEIASRGWQEFYGENSPSRSASTLIDRSRPIEVITRRMSRATSVSDTLMYVINFVDDNGYALVSADKEKEELLAITEKGHYFPETESLENENIGFNLWLNNIIIYLSESEKTYASRFDFIGGGGGPAKHEEWNDTVFFNKTLSSII